MGGGGTINFVKALIPLIKEFIHEVSTSKNDHPNKGKRPLQVSSKEKKFIYAPRREEKLRCSKESEEATTRSHHLRCTKQIDHLSLSWSYSTEV